MMRQLCLYLAVSSCMAADPDPVRRIPPPGIPVPERDRSDLTAGAEGLAKRIASVRSSLITRPQAIERLPDVQIFHKAVDWALRHDEFFDPKQLAVAKRLLEIGRDRAEALRGGGTPWDASTGLVVRAYCSKIDGSIQPYGMVVPEDWTPSDKRPRPLHFWCHGRGEKLSELDFVDQRMTRPGEFTPPGAFVLPVQEPEDFAIAIRRKLILEVSGAEPPARVIRAAGSNIDCMIGEKLRPSYMERYYPELDR